MIRASSNSFLAKDFIETGEGLVFAVVESGLEQGKVLSFLRYRKISSGWQKLTTEKANAYLQVNYPEYLFHSAERDAHLHAISADRILKHYRPENTLQNLLKIVSEDDVIKDLQQLCQIFSQAGLALKNVGITGSIIINAQKQGSDIDLVIYDRTTFFKIRSLVKHGIDTHLLKALSQEDWQASYQRRSCELSLAEYIWHEQRKLNKAVINDRKFDLSLVDHVACQKNINNTKLGHLIIQTVVTGDENAFDYPAIFEIDSEQAQSIICYTATYTGQAFIGERVEVSGVLEQDENGVCKIIVGITREAEDHYIKVLN